MYCDVGTDKLVLYRGLCYTEVCYIEVSLYLGY
jgi:hypothetical protein